MIQINIVSRINEDKNSFFDLIYALHKLNEDNVDDVFLLFIGDILSQTVYQDMLRLIKLFNLSERISFTKKSIRFADLSESVKQGYFFNFTIGNFMGYSGIESINMGFKTIFYNAEKKLSNKTISSVAQCADIPALLSLILKIKENTVILDQQILKDNLRMKNEFILSADDKSFLMSILSLQNLLTDQ